AERRRAGGRPDPRRRRASPVRGGAPEEQREQERGGASPRDRPAAALPQDREVWAGVAPARWEARSAGAGRRPALRFGAHGGAASCGRWWARLIGALDGAPLPRLGPARRYSSSARRAVVAASAAACCDWVIRPRIRSRWRKRKYVWMTSRRQ